MNRNLQNKMATLFLAIVAILLAMPSGRQAEAQYCDFSNIYYWYPYAVINDVEMFNVSEGKMEWENVDTGLPDNGNSWNLNPISYTVYEDEERLLKQGNTYQMTIRWGVMYYYGGIDVYLDWNGDGIFEGDQLYDGYTTIRNFRDDWSKGTVGAFPSEHLYQRVFYCPYYPDCYFYSYPRGARDNPENQEEVFQFEIPKTIPEVETRLRVRGHYYYYYRPGPCGIYYPDYFGYDYGYGEVEDYVVKIAQQLPDTYPAAGNILFNNEEYDGTTRMRDGQPYTYRLPALEFQGPQPVGTQVKYSIAGPLPSRNVVYTMLDPNNGSDVITFNSPTTVYQAQSATGSASVSVNEGTFYPTKGGEYVVNVEVVGVGSGSKVFTVANDYDMSVSEIISPRTNRFPRFFKYLRNTGIAVTAEVQNTGLNPVKYFIVKGSIYDADTDQLVRNLPDIIYDADNDPGKDPLAPGQKYEVNFSNFSTPFVGEYYIKFEVVYVFDEEEYNNHLPRPDAEKHYFEVQYNDQIAAGSITNPMQDQILRVNRPYAPTAEFFNQGISDASNVNFRMVVKNEAGTVVYNEVSFAEDIPQGRYNKRIVTFPNMILDEEGVYDACAWVEYPYDQKNDDDTTCISFTVTEGIKGTYTVGMLNESVDGFVSDRNFETVQEMMDALYAEGIAGSVEFKFTDAKYTLTGFIPWDLSARIIGVDENNTITMRPANNRIAVRGGVKFELNSQSGIGVRFGHSLEPTNNNAVIASFAEREYARSAGYITFDGGSQKAFEFELNTDNPIFGAAIYMNRGTRNTTVKNSVITNNSPQIRNSVTLPTVKFGVNTGFVYDEDVTRNESAQDVSYSAGVVNRSTLMSNTEFIGDLRDTLTNDNNKIMNNDISGFGVGVFDAGLGVLRHDYSSNPNVLDTLKTYYNTNNEISGNRIWDAARTGVFVGYSHNTKVERNLIWDVNAPSGVMASGVEAGGVLAQSAKGYHNVGLSILGNRITGLSSNTNVTGVRVEQDRTIYETGENPKIFPREAENTRIANNFIWGLNITSGNASRAGIHLLTERGDDVVTPDVKSYTTRADDIVNNTILIGNSGMSNTGMTAGIGLQNGSFTDIYNNAISIVDEDIDENTMLAAGILFQGNMSLDNINIDRNVYWTGRTESDLDDSNIDLFRYIEQDKNRDVVSMGYNLEYVSLNQIQAATNTQNNSVYGNFLMDHELYQRDGIEPMLYRVKTNPTPLNSVLNNRGQRIDWLTEDFEGDLRGAAGQRYDIGADEFTGRLYVFDLSPVTILTPRSYRDVTTEFADAEYVMTEAPVNVKINVRNNGSIQQSGTKVYVKIYREEANGSFSSVPVLEKEVETNIPSTNNTEVDFGLSDGLDGDDWTPMSYSDLINSGNTSYLNNIPSKFGAMQANVTPRYRIDIVVGSDQENLNNVYSKEVRFYLKKTNRHIIVSSVNTMADPLTAGTSATVGKLNYNKIIEGFNSIGYTVSAYAEEPVYDYDIFDRGSWEPRAVDYTMYNFMFYSDGYETVPNRWEREDIYSYLEAGDERLKNSMVVSTEEWSELNTDEEFNNRVLRTNYVSNDPLGTGDSYEGNTIIGETISKDFVVPITIPMYNNSGTMMPYPNDVAPYPAVVTPRNSGSDGKPLSGLAYPAYMFNLPSPQDGQVFGTTTITIGYNIIHNTVDWRNYGDIETIMRGTIDHLERNDASIVPVELADFNAEQDKRSVVLDWSTATEINASKFIVERADVNGKSIGNYMTTGLEVAAVGKSTEMNYYGPVVDNNVEYGNTYAYRLRTVDFDGTSAVSDMVRVVEVKGSGNFEFIGFTANPASTVTNVKFEANAQEMTLEVVNVNGQVVYQDNNIEPNGSYPLNVSDLPLGAYTVVLRSASGMQTRQLSIVR